MASGNILIVEDDRTLLGVLRYNFVKEGYTVLTAGDGVRALQVARSEKPDLIILDVMLPEMNGFDVCRILRRETTVPILMLTARVDEIDRVVGLEMGADDYISKPFSMRELVARVAAMLRRVEMVRQEMCSDGGASPIIESENLKIDCDQHKVFLDDKILKLSPAEFKLLVFLVKNRGRVFSRSQLLDKVWEYDYEGGTRTVDVHIRWLREKIESVPSHPQCILTVRGVGYKFER